MRPAIPHVNNHFELSKKLYFLVLAYRHRFVTVSTTLHCLPLVQSGYGCLHTDIISVSEKKKMKTKTNKENKSTISSALQVLSRSPTRDTPFPGEPPMHTSDHILPKVIKCLAQVKKLLNKRPRLESESSDPKSSALPALVQLILPAKLFLPNRNYEDIPVYEYRHFYITGSNLLYTTGKISKASIQSTS